MASRALTVATAGREESLHGHYTLGAGSARRMFPVCGMDGSGEWLSIRRVPPGIDRLADSGVG
jgi:hypothetical protein